MSTGELQYISETAIMEKVMRLRAPLERQAGVFDLIGDSLGSVAQQIQQYVLSDIDTSSAGSLVISLLKLMEPVILFRKHWLLGLLDGVAQAMGYSLTDIVVKMVSSVKGLLMGGEPVSSDQIQQIGSNMIAAESPEAAADDIRRGAFADLYELDKAGQLFKFAAGPLDMFRALGKYRTYSLLVRIVGWFLKTMLLSAGLLVGGGMIAKTLGLSKKTPTTPEKAPEEERVTPGAGMTREMPPVAAPMPTPAPAPSIGLQPSGRGEEYHPNDSYTAWIVPIYGSVRNTLMNWTTEIYPELKGHEAMIGSLPSFNRMANILNEQLDYRTPNYLMMPPRVNRRIDVVNTFAGEAAARLKQKGSK